MVANQNVSSRWSLQTSPWRTDIRILLISAMIVFLITVAIGLLNGQHITTLSQQVLLTHVHAGTIGWITLSVFAISIWIFGEGAPQGTNQYIRWSSIIAAISVPLYVLAFLSGIPIARAVLGVPVLLVMIAFLGWVAARISKIRLGVAQVAILAALLTLVLGGVLGVLLQIQSATVGFLPNGAAGGHPATMVAGYLVLIGMALSELSLMPDTDKVSWLGITQVILFFLAGLAIGAGLLFDLKPLLGLNTLFQLIGVIIYIIRFAPKLIRVNWLGHNSSRFFAISVLFVVVNIALTVSLITGKIPGNPPPPWLIIPLDHSIFIGVMTNAIFGLINDATQERRSLWPWAEDVLFWGMNIGLTGFLVALLSGIPVLERIFTPIMGLSILLGLLMYALRMRTSPPAQYIEATATASYR